MTPPLITLGLQLTLATMRVNSACAKADRSDAGQAEWVAAVQEQELLRTRYRAVLAAETGVRADLIEKALAL